MSAWSQIKIVVASESLYWIMRNINWTFRSFWKWFFAF